MRKMIVVIICLLANQALASQAYQYSGPYTKNNLSIMLIHGKSSYAKNLLTLSEAMKQGKVKVYETGSVNKLAIENVSNSDIYIQAGDIVKGGKQDRVFSDDMVLPKKSGRQDISSFCVEAGRWRKRGTENVKQFSESNYRLSSKELKLATKMKKNQSEVWDKVRQMQTKMSRALGKNVQKRESASSLQLSLEDKDAKIKVKDYVNAFKNLAKKKNVLGFAFSINGKLNSVDIYANHNLFEKMWPRLLQAAATEALIEKQEMGKYPAISDKEVRALMVAEKGKTKRNRINKRTEIKTTENNESFKAHTYDQEHGVVVHTNLITK